MNKKRKSFLTDYLIDQQRWIASCGGDLAGYIAKYGDDRGHAIYKADTDALHDIQNKLAA